VAGFVRPGDRVDVLLNLRGSNNDESGGGSAVTLLQAVEILAIDNQLEVTSAAESIKSWIKEGLASVTLLVTPEQALQLSLGQASGTLSLALRRSDDTEMFEAPPVTVRQIREFQELIARASHTEDQTPPDVAPSGNDPPPASPFTATPAPPPPTYIRTLRGDQSGFVRVVRMAESNP
jgi:Flp pilus assembly protein CpaB